MHVSRQSPPTALYQLLNSIPFHPPFRDSDTWRTLCSTIWKGAALSSPIFQPSSSSLGSTNRHDERRPRQRNNGPANFVSIRGFHCRAVINDGAEAPPPRSRLISPCASLLARPFNTLAIESSSQDWPERTETERVEGKRGLDLHVQRRFSR